jgi:hypothetical protein
VRKFYSPPRRVESSLRKCTARIPVITDIIEVRTTVQPQPSLHHHDGNLSPCTRRFARRAAAPPPLAVRIAHDPTKLSAGPTTDTSSCLHRPTRNRIRTLARRQDDGNPALTPSAGERGPHDVGSAHTGSVPPSPTLGTAFISGNPGRLRGCTLCGLRSAELGQERLSGDGSRVEGRRVDNEKRAGTRRAFEEMERHAVGTWSVARAARSIAPPSPCTRRLASGTTSSKGEALTSSTRARRARSILSLYSRTNSPLANPGIRELCKWMSRRTRRTLRIGESATSRLAAPATTCHRRHPPQLRRPSPVESAAAAPVVTLDTAKV